MSSNRWLTALIVVLLLRPEAGTAQGAGNAAGGTLPLPIPSPGAAVRRPVAIAERGIDTAAEVASPAIPGRIAVADRVPNPWSVLKRSPGLAALASAAVPGAGQLALGDDRFIVYMAAEALLWLKLAKDHSSQASQERRFRTLARQVARLSFGESLPDGDWDYYEAMEKWIESGVYSRAPAGLLLPDNNPTTFNGARWVLAQRNHGIDPAAEPDAESAAYRAALAEYAATAIRPEFQWSWRNAQLEYDLYRRTIDRRNDAAHAVGAGVTLLLANHVLSTVDAFASWRLRVTRTGGGVSVGARLPVTR